jgi:hypothetical protein
LRRCCQLFSSSTTIYWRPVSSPLPPLPIFDHHILEAGFIAAPTSPHLQPPYIGDRFHRRSRHFPPSSSATSIFLRPSGKRRKVERVQVLMSAGVGIKGVFVRIVASPAEPLRLPQTLVLRLRPWNIRYRIKFSRCHYCSVDRGPRVLSTVISAAYWMLPTLIAGDVVIMVRFKLKAFRTSRARNRG